MIPPTPRRGRDRASSLPSDAGAKFESGKWFFRAGNLAINKILGVVVILTRCETTGLGRAGIAQAFERFLIPCAIMLFLNGSGKPNQISALQVLALHQSCRSREYRGPGAAVSIAFHCDRGRFAFQMEMSACLSPSARYLPQKATA